LSTSIAAHEFICIVKNCLFADYITITFFMIKSMTGYGKAVCERPGKNIILEIKSLNSKGLDLNCRIPYLYKEKELQVRSFIAEKLIRGKIDFSIYIESNLADTTKTINKTVATQYYKELSELAESLGLETGIGLLQTVMKFPDTLSTELEMLDETEWHAVYSTLHESLQSIDQFRIHEGEALKNDLTGRIKNIEECLEKILPLAANRTERIKDRIRKSLVETVGTDAIDENRFEQELIFYIEKLDITEEEVRLRQHCRYFIENMESEATSVGRKLNFISQEIGREINTIGSKANDADIQKLVIQMKDELEKIKEQSLNIL